MDAYVYLRNICMGNFTLSVAGLIPGYWVSFLSNDSWRLKLIQLVGFVVCSILFIIMGSA
ncbi:hypothetical protein NEOLEDRAFT_1138533 [Neolentinus lepideus HHB14362 ss-1]|uniref:Major facilitator superfamily (MFS) profile domain-containing protein n=1 Tax=Neolentinus lepideus HHB14362 ss-1 TaxID=1314782 RepID=A0A165Q724_9AGAM|nr:hypothetical protein NEOLEDRAFT_1138533 [Neolentinus lepideus HHB14362 ss-1]